MDNNYDKKPAPLLIDDSAKKKKFKLIDKYDSNARTDLSDKTILKPHKRKPSIYDPSHSLYDWDFWYAALGFVSLIFMVLGIIFSIKEIPAYSEIVILTAFFCLLTLFLSFKIKSGSNWKHYLWGFNSFIWIVNIISHFA